MPYAIQCDTFGDPGVMRWDVSTPPLAGDGSVLIKVAAAGVNRADLLQRQGKYPPPEGASPIIGVEVAGEVVALGAKARRWKIGDKVCALVSGGGYAEYVAAPDGQCLPMAERLSMIEGAALMEALVTVFANLFEAGQAKREDIVLVHGGSSGIGTAAIQLAKLSGMTIFVTVGTSEKAEACRMLGADLVINYKEDDFVAAVIDKTGGRGVDVVVDMVGGDYIPRNLSVLAVQGRHVSIATQQSRPATLDVRLVMQKRLTVTGSTLRTRADVEKARLITEVEAKIWPWVVSGQYKPLIYQAFRIKDAAEAHKVMESGSHIGKIVLEVA
jgi:NADPH2:quinone reductase